MQLFSWILSKGMEIILAQEVRQTELQNRAVSGRQAYSSQYLCVDYFRCKA